MFVLKCQESENQGIQMCDIFTSEKNVKDFLIKHYPEITQNLHFEPVDDESERFYRVVHIATCADFYIRDVEEDEIVQAISDVLELNEESRTLSKDEIHVGYLAAAKYSDSKWFVLVSNSWHITMFFLIHNCLNVSGIE